MQSLKTSIVLLVLWQYNVGISAQKSKKFFRSDYTYFDETESFYKIHTIHQPWQDAKKACAAEGAELLYPRDVAEAELVTEFFKHTQPFSWVYVGASAILAKGVYETLDGVPVQNLYHKWGPGEPNDGNPEDCVVLRKEGTLHDENCANKYPFVCKKTLATLEWNEKCDIPNTDYQFNEYLGRCYKFHLNPLTWTEAYAACAAEQSYLAVIDSQAEALHLVTLTEKAPKDSVDGYYLRGAVHVGFHNKTGEGWTTIKGVPLTESGYKKWGYGEPNGNGKELCGTMYYTGQLNDLGCDSWRCFFICEHDVTRQTNHDLENTIDQ